MKIASTLFLRGVVLLGAAPALLFAAFVAVNAIKDKEPGYYTVIFVGAALSTLPFFFALYQVMRILNYIDTNKAFSDLSVKALDAIKYSAIAFAAMYTLGMPYIYYVADMDDAPGVVLIGLIFIFVSVFAATFTAVLERLLKDALAIKSENDLTI